MADIFLMIENIQGESTDLFHKDEIEIVSFSWNENNPSSGVSPTPGKVVMSDLSVQMAVSKASPKLFLFCAKGDHIRTAFLTVRKPGKGREYYLKWTFSDIQITSYGATINPGEQKPTDHITLNFKKIEIEYKETKPDGTLGPPVKAGWDVVQNKPV